MEYPEVVITDIYGGGDAKSYYLGLKQGLLSYWGKLLQV